MSPRTRTHLHPESLPVSALITALVALGQISTSIYIPSMPSIVADLATTPERVNLTLSGFLLGFAICQLVFGPGSDHFGRRPVLFVGLGLYLLATLLCALAPDIDTLILGRLLQGMAACAGPVLGRAIVRDVYGASRTAAAMAWIGAALAISPAVAPIIGGYLQEWFGWRASFVFLLVVCVILSAAAWRLLAETSPRHNGGHNGSGHSLRRPSPETASQAGPDMGSDMGSGTISGTVSGGASDAVSEAGSGPAPAAAFDAPRLLMAFGTLLADRIFVGYTLCVAFIFAGLMAYAAGGPFVFITLLGLAPSTFGMLAVFTVGGYLVGSLSAGRLSRTVSARRLSAAGLVMSLLGSAGLLVPALTAAPSVLAVVAPMVLFTAGLGIVLPAGIAGAMAPFPRIAGAASALLGFVQMLVAAAASLATGLFHAPSALPMAGVIAASTVLAALAFMALVRREPSGDRQSTV